MPNPVSSFETLFHGFPYRFDKREEATAAIDNLNGKIPHGRINPISVKIAEEHGKQKAAYFAGWEAGRQQARRKSNLV